jgi:ceramide glucosyltransferase
VPLRVLRGRIYLEFSASFAHNGRPRYGHVMETLFTLFAFLLLLQSLVALAAALRFARYALRVPAGRLGRYQPKAAVVVPCRGLDLEFEENIRPLFAQDYHDYELIFVTESEADPAHAALSGLIRQSHRSAWLVVAGEAEGRGQKIHNLCAALDTLNAIDRRVEVLVFADADARPGRDWLAELVAPLGDPKIGATTGFRWYLPARGRLSSLLLAAWNASALTLLGERSGFAWGGATAVRRETFDQLGVRRRWEGALSDDYVLTRAVHEADQRIKFVPPCLMGTRTDAGWDELLEFSTRQMTITRIYAPRVWGLACATHSFYNLAFWGGLGMLLVTGLGGGASETLASLLLAIFALGAMAGWVRAVVASHLLSAHHRAGRPHWWAFLCLGPLVSLVYLYNLIASARTNRVVWRGIGYEMVSPSETVIRQRPAAASPSDQGAEAPVRQIGTRVGAGKKD